MRSYKIWILVLSACILISMIVGTAVFFAQKKVRRPKVIAEGEPQLVVQLGHSGGISSAAFSSDGRFIVSGGTDPIGRGISDKTAILWETATGREIRRFVGHTDSINAVAFSPDGRFVLTGSGGETRFDENGNLLDCGDCTARLWDVATGKEIRRFIGHKAAVKSVAFSPDGRFALTDSSGVDGVSASLRLWNIADGSELRRFSDSEAAFSADGRFVLSDAGILWDVMTGKELRRFIGHKPEMASIAFSSDGRFALTGSSYSPYSLEEPVATLWDVITGKVVRRFKGCSPVAFSPDGSQILTGIATIEKRGAQLLKTETGGMVRYFTKGNDPDSEEWFVESASFSPNGEFVLIVLGERSAGGNMGYTVGETSLRLYNLASGKDAQRFESESVGLQDDLVFSSNGALLLSGNGLWDLRMGNEIQFRGYSFDESEYRKNAEPFLARRQISKDGRFALTLKTSVENEVVQLWDASIGKEIFKLPATSFDYVPSFWFAPDNRFIFIFGQVKHDGLKRFWAVSCWEIGTRKEVWQYIFRRELWHHEAGQKSRANTDCALSPEGRFLAIRELGKSEDDAFLEASKVYPIEWHQEVGVTLLNAHTGQVFRRLNIPPDFSNIGILEFSPDSRFLAVESPESLLLYDIAADKVVREFQNILSSSTKPKGANTSTAFSPGGQFLLTGSRWIDGGLVVQLWDVATGKEIRRFPNQSARQAVFSLDSRFLFTTDVVNAQYGKTVYLWDIASGKEVRRFEGHSDAITSLAISPDGRLLLTGSADHTERLWSIVTGQELCRMLSLSNGSWIVTTPDGRFDTNDLEDIKGLHWVMSSDPLKPLPLEIFMRQYYEPRLLSRVLASEKLKPLPKLSR